MPENTDPIPLTPPPDRPPGKTFPPGLQQVWVALEEQIAQTLYIARTAPEQLDKLHMIAIRERMGDLAGKIGEHLALICLRQQPGAVQNDPEAVKAWQVAFFDRLGLTPYLPPENENPPEEPAP